MMFTQMSELKMVQEEVNKFHGEWTSRLPIEGVTSGNADLFQDRRIESILAMCPEAKSALELGCLEGGHTYMLSMRGIEVTAVDGNARAGTCSSSCEVARI